MGLEDGLLLVNLGSPASPKVYDVRTYLTQFLHDPYVIDLPAPVRRLLVEGLILRTRPKRSAAAYQKIWWEEGSPLVVLTERLASKVRQRIEVPVVFGMRYGVPSIASAISELQRLGVRRIVMMPLYPQYAMASTLTAVEDARAAVRMLDPSLDLVIVPPFYSEPEFLDAEANLIRYAVTSTPDHMLFSYHGLPERHLRKTDPTNGHCLRSSSCCETASEAHATCYRHQCIRTTESLLRRCEIAPARATMTFQSRLGMDQWLRPYTLVTALSLAQAGVNHLAIVCPSFVTDCLETLEEIGHGLREAFMSAGGQHLTVIPCLNDSDMWADAVVSIAQRTMHPTQTV